MKKIITLDKFIYQALYEKKKGYYMKNISFDKHGDFITSPNISVLFSEIITIWIIMYWQNIGRPKKFDLIELGAGNGEMMFQIIKTSKIFSDFNNAINFYIIEKSDYLKKVQKKKLSKFKIKWINNINKFKSKNKCLFLGNEFLDAFPIKQLQKIKNTWYEKYVHEYYESRTINNKKINIKKYHNILGIEFIKNKNFIEFSPSLINFIKKLSIHVKKCYGGVLFIDYGYLKKSMINSLQGVKGHKKYNLLLDKGEVDITHLINFYFLKKILNDNGLNVNGITTQGNFLRKMGIIERAELLSKNKIFSYKVNLYNRLKRIIDKKEMGDLFKVIFASHKSIKFKKGF